MQKPQTLFLAMTFVDLDIKIIAQQLCSGCGACAAVCPALAISIDADSPTNPRFIGSSTDICKGCSLCTEVCPGKSPETPELELALLGVNRTADARWVGVYKSAMYGRATDDQVYMKSASGGSVTALIRGGLKTGFITAALVCGRDSLNPRRPQFKICREVDELTQSQQSTYQISPMLVGLRSLMDEGAGALEEALLLTLLPCQVQAFRKLQRMSGALSDFVRSKVKVVIEIACSSSTLPQGTDHLIESKLKISPSEVSDVRYRDGDYPGKFRARLHDDSSLTCTFREMLESFRGFKTHRCLSCGDWMSGLADISVCDGDQNILVASEVPQVWGKRGIVLVRTAIGELLVKAASDTGEFIIDGNTAEIRENINLGLARKRARRAEYQRMGNLPIPDGPIKDFVDRSTMSEDELLR